MRQYRKEVNRSTFIFVSNKDTIYVDDEHFLPLAPGTHIVYCCLLTNTLENKVPDDILESLLSLVKIINTNTSELYAQKRYLKKNMFGTATENFYQKWSDALCQGVA